MTASNVFNLFYNYDDVDSFCTVLDVILYSAGEKKRPYCTRDGGEMDTPSFCNTWPRTCTLTAWTRTRSVSRWYSQHPVQHTIRLYSDKSEWYRSR